MKKAVSNILPIIKEDDKVYYQLYNIASGDNFFFILRNLDDSHRIWRSYETDGDRYVALKIRCTERRGALVASGVEGGKTEAADTVEYRLCETRKTGRQWKPNGKDGSGAAGIFGNGSGKRRYGNEVFYKHFLHMKNCRIKKSIFNFVYVKTEQTAKL